MENTENIETSGKDKAEKKISLESWGLSLIAHIFLIGCLAFVGFRGSGVLGHGEHGVEIGDGIYETKGNETAESQSESDNLTDIVANFSVNLDVSLNDNENLNTENILSLDIPEADGEFSVAQDLATSSPSVEGETNPEDWAGLVQGFGENTGGSSGAGKSFFGISDKGQSFVYIVDCSGSMKDQRLKAAKAELLRSVKSLEEINKFCMIFYNSGQITYGTPELMAGDKKNIRSITKWIASQNASGGTNPKSALESAVSLDPDAIWLLSDGEFQDKEAIFELARNIKQKNKLRIHTIAFMDETGADTLRYIAKITGGKYRFVKPRRDITNRSKK